MSRSEKERDAPKKDDIAGKIEGTAATKNAGKVVVRGTNILNTVRSGSEESTDNSMDQVSIEFDADSFEEGLKELETRAARSMPSGCKSYSIFMEDVENGQRVTQNYEVANMGEAIKQLRADMKAGKNAPPVPRQTQVPRHADRTL